MRPSAAVHDAAAALLEYPTDGHGDAVRRCVEVIGAEVPGAAGRLDGFARSAAASDLSDAEELYVRTFDVNAERALETGWQVFGEQYARGAFLARLRGLLAEHGVAETTELPDHLTQVLRLLGRAREADACAIISRVVRPAVRRVRADLGDDHGYAAVLDAVAEIVELHGAAASEPPAPKGSGLGTRHDAGFDGPGGGVGDRRAVR